MHIKQQKIVVLCALYGLPKCIISDKAIYLTSYDL